MLRLNYIKGENFTGKTSFLKTQIEAQSLYIGEDPTDYLSGIMPQVKDEILLHLHKDKNSSVIDKFVITFDFQNLLQTNPYSLSGGEKTILCLFVHLLLNKQKILIDSTLEQLNKEWRDKLMDFITSEFVSTEFYLADNRFEEYNWICTNSLHPNANSTSDFQIVFDKPDFNIQLENSSTTYQNILVIQDLYFSYDKKRNIFSGVNLCFESGIYHLKGINGAGKSTLSKIILGLLKPKKGKILLNAEHIKPYKYPGKYSSYATQNPSDQIFNTTVEREVVGSNQIDSKRLLPLLHYFGLYSVKDTHPEDLPFVIRKRICIAAAIYDQKDILILDESSLGQDNNFVKGLADLINSLSKSGKIIIVISHSDYFISLLENVKQVKLIKS